VSFHAAALFIALLLIHIASLAASQSRQRRIDLAHLACWAFNLLQLAFASQGVIAL